MDTSQTFSGIRRGCKRLVDEVDYIVLLADVAFAKMPLNLFLHIGPIEDALEAHCAAESW